MMRTRLSVSFLLLALLVLLFVACSKSNDTAGGSTEDSGIIAITDKVVAGVAQKGPFIKGSSVVIKELDGRTFSQTGRQISTKVINDKGEYTLSNVSLASQYALVEVNGYYRNEVTGAMSAGPITLSAITDLSNRDSVNVNVLTHVEGDRILKLVQDGAKYADAKKQAEEEIRRVFDVSEPVSDFEDLNAFGSNKEDGVLLSLSIMLQGDLSEGELIERLADISIDVETDGVWSNKVEKDRIVQWTAQADFEQIYENVNSLGVAEKPLEKSSFVDEFVKTNEGASDPASSSSDEVSKSSSSNDSGLQAKECTNSFVDERDGIEYCTTEIGSQVWMAENLSYQSENSVCSYSPGVCGVNGALYRNDLTNVCPSGWHIPTKAEWDILMDFVGGQDIAAKMLRAVGAYDNFNYPSTADDKDEFGFSAYGGLYLSSTLVSEEDSKTAFYYIQISNADGIEVGSLDISTGQGYVRCIQD